MENLSKTSLFSNSSPPNIIIEAIKTAILLSVIADARTLDKKKNARKYRSNVSKIRQRYHNSIYTPITFIEVIVIYFLF